MGLSYGFGKTNTLCANPLYARQKEKYYVLSDFDGCIEITWYFFFDYFVPMCGPKIKRFSLLNEHEALRDSPVIGREARGFYYHL